MVLLPTGVLKKLKGQQPLQTAQAVARTGLTMALRWVNRVRPPILERPPSGLSLANQAPLTLTSASRVLVRLRN